MVRQEEKDGAGKRARITQPCRTLFDVGRMAVYGERFLKSAAALFRGERDDCGKRYVCHPL
jgi:hypothetical protein